MNSKPIVRFGALSDAELLALADTPEGATAINDSIRAEAAHRGIAVPIELPEALRTSGYLGYQPPVESVPVYVPRSSGGGIDDEVGYLTRERAEAALVGAVRIRRDWGNPRGGFKLSSVDGAEAGVRVVYAGGAPQSALAASRLDEALDATPSPEYTALAQECYTRLSAVRQDAYNRKANVVRRAEYLRLANNDAAVAAAFWKARFGTEFPSEDGSTPAAVQPEVAPWSTP